MRVIIAGSRTLADPAIIVTAVAASGYDITEVVSGAAQGVDRLGEEWAQRHDIPVTRFPADWDNHGRAAGPIRNNQMVSYVGAAGALLAIWDGASSGTAHVISAARREGRKVFVYQPGKGGRHVQR
jgi:hypothetical protein